MPVQTLCLALSISCLLPGCKKQSAISAEKAKGDVVALALAAHNDVAEVRAGLPQGAKFLLPIFSTGKPASDDPRGSVLRLRGLAPRFLIVAA